MGTFDVFPMPADANYNYAEAFDRRPGGHHGTDVFAPRGTPVLAVFDGDARSTTDPKGGTVVYLTGARDFAGTVYYAHLDSVEPHLASGKSQFVNAGDVIGYVGTSGNAANTPPHLHIQVTNPNGRGIANPFPHLVDVDTKRGGRRIDPTKPREEQAGSLTDNDVVLIGGAAVVVFVLWLLFKSDNKQRSAA